MSIIPKGNHKQTQRETRKTRVRIWAIWYNITLLKLPPYAPEFNPMENVPLSLNAGIQLSVSGQYLRTNKLAITVFDSYEDILDKCSDAWNFFANDPDRITSITRREWIEVN